VLLSVLVLLLLAGAAYGLGALGGSRASSPSSPHGIPWLGARLQDWPAGGALVNSVTPGSAAASAGLKPGDVIVQVEGRPVTAAVNVSAAVGALSVGDRLELVVLRGGRTFAASAPLRARPPDTP
jgi:S1-C subfamily serine protease